jgi:hypothetical protein
LKMYNRYPLTCDQSHKLESSGTASLFLLVSS